ncbi:MAG: zinc ABC transporter substrate-binding protein [Thermicanus sp.]|nr:zinc ABC transporter substrate-binding protein [Thermicanus sp.]
MKQRFQRYKQVYLFLAILFFSSSLLAACSDGGGEVSDKTGKIMIYTTLFPFYDFSKEIGGDYVTVKNLLPPGVEPHDFEPKPKDMVALQEADLFIYNGAGFEAWIDKAVTNLDQKKTKVINASDGAFLLSKGSVLGDAAHAEGGGESHTDQANGTVDPHLWFDMDNTKLIVKKIYEALKELDPVHEGEYTRNYENYLRKVDELDRDYQTGLKNAKKKEFMVSHAAFGYLAHRYGLTQIPVSGISPEETPGQADMIRLVETAKRYGLRYIGFESFVDNRVAETIRREAGLQAVTLYTIDNVTSDQMEKGAGYLDLMRENLTTLKKMTEVEGG